MSQPGQTKGLDEIFCPSCAQIIKRDAAICFHCGVPLAVVPAATIARRPRSKAVAVILAVFLGYWAWLYTYRRDAWKFWLNLALTIVTLLVWAVVAWIWAIIDTAARPASFYENYGQAVGPYPGAAAVGHPAELPPLPPEDAEGIHSYRRDLLLQRLGEANARAARRPSAFRVVVGRVLFPLLAGLAFSTIVVLPILLAIGREVSRSGPAQAATAPAGRRSGTTQPAEAPIAEQASSTPEYPGWYDALIVIIWLASSIAVFLLLRILLVRRAAAKQQRLRQEADRIAGQLEKEFPEFVKEFGGREGLRDFLPPGMRRRY